MKQKISKNVTEARLVSNKRLVLSKIQGYYNFHSNSRVRDKILHPSLIQCNVKSYNKNRINCQFPIAENSLETSILFEERL